MRKRQPKHTLYCYVDESGQDTNGRFFAVAVLVTGAEQAAILAKLERLEELSGKGAIKWHKSIPEARKEYCQGLATSTGMQHRLFLATYAGRKDFVGLTADAIARTLREKKGDRAIIYVDALRDTQKDSLKRQLRPSVGIPTMVRGIRREENSAFIRLVDAICGLARDADDKNTWAQKMVQKLEEAGILKTV